MLLNSWKSAFIPCGCNVRGRSMPGSAGASTVCQKLLHRSPRIGKSRAGRIVLADTGRDPDAFSVAGGVGVSPRHIARGAAQDRLDFARRELRIDLKQQRTQAGELWRGGRGSAEYAPAVSGLGAVEGGAVAIDLATRRNGERQLVRVLQETDQAADIPNASPRIDSPHECARLVR